MIKSMFVLVVVFFTVFGMFGCNDDDGGTSGYYVKFEAYGDCSLVSINNEIITNLNEGRIFENWVHIYDIINNNHKGEIKIEKLTGNDCNIYLDVYDNDVLIYSETNNNPYGVIEYKFDLQ